MHLRRLLVLIAVAAVLVAVVFFVDRGGEDLAASQREHALLEGFDRARVAALHVDNLERSLQLKIVNQADGSWAIVDPIQYPAEPSVIELVLDQLATQRAKPVANADPAKLSLSPPRVVIEVEERGVDSNSLRRIELGTPDIDSQQMFARVDGVVVRTERGLDATLDRDLPDWRSRNILHVAPMSVVELHRTGRIQTPDATSPTDLALDAVLDSTWRATQPFVAKLDPQPMAALIASAAFLQAESFIDSPGELALYGLDRPRIRIELADERAVRDVLLLTPEPGSERWYAAREGAPYIFSISQESLLSMTAPTVAMIDRKLVELTREAVNKVVLTADDRSLTIAREPRGWSLGARDGERATIDGDIADPQRVDDLLTALEHARLLDLLFDKTWDPQQVTGSIRVESGSDVQGGEFGPAYTSPDGGRGVVFRRYGDQLVSVVDPALLALAGTDPQAMRSLELHKVPELDVARIELASGAEQRVYVLGAKGQWMRQGTEIEARDFAKLVDRLLSMKALAILQRGADDKLDDAVDVRLVTHRGDVVAFTLGTLAPSGEEPYAVYRNGSRLARIKPELQRELRSLLGAK